MSKIKLLIVVFVFGLAGAVYASNPAIQDKPANHSHANHSEASCCSTGAACCDGGSCCTANKEPQAGNTDKDGQSGVACCAHKTEGKKATSKPEPTKKGQTAKNGTAKNEAGCCSGGSCCTGGSCCVNHKS